jgi:hypothetical protein
MENSVSHCWSVKTSPSGAGGRGVGREARFDKFSIWDTVFGIVKLVVSIYGVANLV